MTKRTALVTGAGGGLGHATVERLVANGWKVFAADIDKDLLRSSMHDPDVVPIVMDVTDGESIKSAYDAITTHTEHLDGLVNFAGILGVGSLTDIPEERLARILDINVMGTYRVNKKFLPLLFDPNDQQHIPKVLGYLQIMLSKLAHETLGREALEPVVDPAGAVALDDRVLVQEQLLRLVFERLQKAEVLGSRPESVHEIRSVGGRFLAPVEHGNTVNVEQNRATRCEHRPKLVQHHGALPRAQCTEIAPNHHHEVESTVGREVQIVRFDVFDVGAFALRGLAGVSDRIG